MAIDAALIHQCADPSLKPAIVEAFLKAAGSDDPLSVVLKSNGPVLLFPRPKTADEALARIRKYVGSTVVRVGITQYPAGLGIKEPSEISADLLDACKNVRMGTALFGKVWRVVLQTYGNPSDDSLTPEILVAAVDAWKTGRYLGEPVFTAPDPGEQKPPDAKEVGSTPRVADPALSKPPITNDDPNKASIRIDLSAVGRTSP